jgi:hypothetical protein
MDDNQFNINIRERLSLPSDKLSVNHQPFVLNPNNYPGALQPFKARLLNVLYEWVTDLLLSVPDADSDRVSQWPWSQRGQWLGPRNALCICCWTQFSQNNSCLYEILHLKSIEWQKIRKQIVCWMRCKWKQISN